jgi:hypothetical protein
MITENDRTDPSPITTSVDESRRKLGKAGLAAPAVLLSLASKPVMGSTYYCTGSGGMSGNTSSHGEKLSCLACSPGYWKTSPGTWPAPYYPYDVCSSCMSGGNKIHSATTFDSVFGTGPSATMMSILHNDPGSLEFHTIAALLNAAAAALTGSGVASAYTVSEVIQMYQTAPNGETLKDTFAGTYSGSLDTCGLYMQNSNGNDYLAEPGTVFCNVVNSNGTETSIPCCGGTAQNPKPHKPK